MRKRKITEHQTPESTTKALEPYGPTLLVRDWEVHHGWKQPSPKMALVLHSDKPENSRVQVWDRDVLIDFAKSILRTFAPTTEDEILASLHRIEERLSETEE